MLINFYKILYFKVNKYAASTYLKVYIFLYKGCITNSPQEKKNLIHCIDKLKQNFIDKLHIIVGSFNHYFILCLQKDKVYYLDSLNTPLI